VEGTRRGLISSHHPGIFLQGLRKTAKTPVRIGVRAEIEPGTFRIRRSVNHSTTTFGDTFYEELDTPLTLTNLMHIPDLAVLQIHS
jgi:hypothetical protein